MAATVDALGPERVKTIEEWTVILPRRGKQRRSVLDLKAAELHQGEWTPPEDKIDPDRESKLLQKLQACMKMLRSSNFCAAFMDQIQSTLIDSFIRVLGSQLKMQMIIYGIGSIEAYENPRLQLSMALLMKEKFDWVGDIEVFDPVLNLES